MGSRKRKKAIKGGCRVLKNLKQNKKKTKKKDTPPKKKDKST